MNKRKLRIAFEMNYLSFILFLILLIVIVNLAIHQFDKEYKRRCLDVWGAGKCVELMVDLMEGSGSK